MTTKEKVLGSALGVAWLAGFSAVWQVAAPQYSDANKARIFLGYLAIGIVLSLWWIKEWKDRRMSLIEFLMWGGGFGLSAGLVVWLMFAIAEKGPASSANGEVFAAAPVATAANGSVTADPKVVAPADELEFYFHPFLIGGGRGNPGGRANIQYSGATMTNRSARKMHLQLWAHAYFWKDDGQPTAFGFQPKWNPDGLDEKTGETTVDLDAFESKEGSLVLFFDKPKQGGVEQWNINAFEKVYIHAFDSVTGKHIAFKATPGYPDAKVPWPLPPPAELLALDFPKTDAAARDLPALESLDLLARTQFFGYHNDNSLSISAVIANRSEDRMKLQISLLTRKSVDDKAWRTIRGVIKPSRKEDRGELDYYALDFGPGDVASCSLVFANTGFTNREGEEFKQSPSVSLLEIFDEVSGKKVWCAIEPGYPPGTDMRWAAIQAPPPIPKSDSDNTKNDETKDTK